MASSTFLAPLAASVREVLSGRTDGQSEIARAIGRPAGAPGWFVPGDAIWTVHGSVATFVGGIRSLYLQALHPLALAGVDRHSTYREDPFGRLQRTGAYLAATTYGSAELAQQTVDAVRVMHRRVQGTASGRSSLLRARTRGCSSGCTSPSSTRCSARTCTSAARETIDADAYVADMAIVGERMGVVDPPRSQAELAECFAGFRPELRVDELVHRTHAFVTNAPLPLALRPGYRVLARAAWATQPDWALEMLGSTPRLGALDVAASDAALRVLRHALVASPARLAGERRLAGEDPTSAVGS